MLQTFFGGFLDFHLFVVSSMTLFGLPSSRSFRMVFFSVITSLFLPELRQSSGFFPVIIICIGAFVILRESRKLGRVWGLLVLIALLWDLLLCSRINEYQCEARGRT